MTDKEALSAAELAGAIEKICEAVRKRNRDCANIVIIGIRTRGVHIAQRISDLLAKQAGVEIPIGALDITLYRDDLHAAGPQPTVKATEINFDLEGKDVVLVDDVLYTGRTTRAALDELIDFGRPRTIQLAVMVDRGGREIPIAADYVGKKIRVKQNEKVLVQLEEIDGRDGVIVTPRSSENGTA